MTESTILVRIQADMTVAMKSQDAATLSTLRMLKSALMEAKTRKPKDASLTVEEEVEVLQRYAKKRRESIAEWTKAGREDLIPGEHAEIAVTARYLPAGVSEDELRGLIRDAIATSGAASPRDLGKVIGLVMPQVKGRAEGGTVSRLVKEALGG